MTLHSCRSLRILALVAGLLTISSSSSVSASAPSITARHGSPWPAEHSVSRWVPLSSSFLSSRRRREHPLLPAARKSRIAFLVPRGGAASDADDDEEYYSADEENEDDSDEVDAEDEENESEEENDDVEEEESEDEAEEEEEDPANDGEDIEVALQEYDEPLMASPLTNMYASIGVMILSRKVNLFSPTMVRIARFAFVAYLILLQLFLLYVRIQAKSDNDRTAVELKNPLSSVLQSQLGGGPGESGGGGMMKSLASSFLSSKSTVLEYDLKQARSTQSGLIFNMLIMWFLHFKMEQIQPLLISTANGITNMVYSPLFQIYVLGRNLERPFKNPAVKRMEEQAAAQQAAAAAAEADDDNETVESLDSASVDEEEDAEVDDTSYSDEEEEEDSDEEEEEDADDEEAFESAREDEGESVESDDNDDEK